ncbi:MAG: hypothetical protein ABFD54_02395 [Armatimonadota bacterium]|nr:hypothetical protein [bacterium]
MKLRTLLIACLSLILIAGAAFAQQGKVIGQKGRQGNGMQMAAQKLGLTADQQQQIKDIVKQFRTDAGDIRKSSATTEEKQSKIKALREDVSAKIMNVLTPEQQEKAKQMNLTRRMFSGRRGNHAMLMKQLNLTKEQQTVIRGILAEARPQIQAIRQNTSLTPDQKKEQLKTIRQGNFEKIKAQLTPEQLQKLQTIMSKRGNKGNCSINGTNVKPAKRK